MRAISPIGVQPHRSWRMVGSVDGAVALGQVGQQLGAAAEAGHRPPAPLRRFGAALPGADREVADPAVELVGDGAGDGHAAAGRPAAGAEAGPLVHERGVGDRPAVVEAADDGVVGARGRR